MKGRPKDAVEEEANERSVNESVQKWLPCGHQHLQICILGLVLSFCYKRLIKALQCEHKKYDRLALYVP